MLPTLNAECVPFRAVRTGFSAINAQINKYSRFDGKIIFYRRFARRATRFSPALFTRIVGEGVIQISLRRGKIPMAPRQGDSGVERIHYRTDAGKLDARPASEGPVLCRSQTACGVARDGKSSPSPGYDLAQRKAAAYVRKLVFDPALLSAAATEYGSRARCAPTSMSACASPAAEAKLGTRTEDKNVNSMRSFQAVIDMKPRRQVDLTRTAAPVSRKPGC